MNHLIKSLVNDEEFPLCAKHLAKQKEFLQIGMSNDTCKHCSIEWDKDWKNLLARNEWFSLIKEGELVYISGPMTNYPDNNHRAFQMMEHALKLRGANVLSPHHHDLPGFPYEVLLRKAIQLMLEAQTVVMLVGWHKSNGAIIERQVADKIKMTIYYEYPRNLASNPAIHLHR